MDAYQKRFSQALTETVEARAIEATELLVTTKCVDYADYCGRREFIMALRTVLADARDIEQNMDRPEQREAPGLSTKHRGYED